MGRGVSILALAIAAAACTVDSSGAGQSDAGSSDSSGTGSSTDPSTGASPGSTGDATSTSGPDPSTSDAGNETTSGAEASSGSTDDGGSTDDSNDDDGSTGDGTSLIEYCTIADTPIPDNNGDGVSSDINVDLAGGGIVQSLELVIEASHSYVGDLRFFLRKGGPELVVIDRPGGGGCNGDDIDVALHDGAAQPVGTSCVPDGMGVPALSGELRPELPLNAVFFNQQMLGTWRLRVSDNDGSDTGVLQSWCLRITYR